MSGFTPKDPDFDRAVRDRIAESPVCRFFGFEVDSVAPGAVTLALAARPEFGHKPGFFQGTIIGAIADYAGSFACYSLLPPGCDRLTLDYTLKFLGPAEGERLIARGCVITPGRTISTAGVDVFVLRASAEHLCATALLTTHHTPPRPA